MDRDFLLWTPALSGQENHIHRRYTGVGKGFVVISGIPIGSCTENSQQTPYTQKNTQYMEPVLKIFIFDVYVWISFYNFVSLYPQL